MRVGDVLSPSSPPRASSPPLSLPLVHPPGSLGLARRDRIPLQPPLPGLDRVGGTRTREGGRRREGGRAERVPPQEIRSKDRAAFPLSGKRPLGGFQDPSISAFPSS